MFKFYFFSLMTFLGLIGAASLMAAIFMEITFDLRIGFAVCGVMMFWTVKEFVKLYHRAFGNGGNRK